MQVDQKPFKGKNMEGWIARWYTRTRSNDMEDFRRQAKSVAQNLRGGCDVLEVAPGPGFFAVELAKRGDFKIRGWTSAVRWWRSRPCWDLPWWAIASLARKRPGRRPRPRDR